MMVPQQEVFSVIRKLNPWWDGTPDTDLPTWRRNAFQELNEWLTDPPSPRAVLISGARQVGKTTLLRQAAATLLASGVPPEQILYATFDNPILKLIGTEGLLKAWEEIQPPRFKVEYLLLDEIQYTKDWQTWLKHQVDFEKRRRIAVTGSSIPLNTENVESGVGRWHTIKLPTLSFYEYLQIKKIASPRFPKVHSLAQVFDWKSAKLANVAAMARPLIPHFHEYLLCGGFPETALIENVNSAQKLLREDIVDKVLKRDMTAQFGTRRVLELEKTFLYLCLHDGGILDLETLSGNLGVTKPTVKHFLDLFEAAHLVYKLSPFGYGKEVLKGRHKYYLADAGISGSVLLKGRSLLEDGAKLGAAVETAFFKHVFTRYYATSVGFSYWRNKRQQEVDIVAEIAGELVPFEVKYSSASIQAKDVIGLIDFCREKKVNRGYVISRELADFELLTGHETESRILKIPAVLACYWLSQLR
ncbi:MAG: ATP-binding protein [Pirellulaceae bacterium]